MTCNKVQGSVTQIDVQSFKKNTYCSNMKRVNNQLNL